MSDYYISQVRASDRYAQQQVDRLLQEEGIRRDANLDYTCAMYDEAMNIIATGSCFENTLRCMAVSSTEGRRRRYWSTSAFRSVKVVV